MTAPAGNIVIIWNPKAVYDEKDYGFKYGPKWLAAGETLTASDWIVTDAATDLNTTELEILSDAIVDSDKTAQVWLKGGVRGKTYKVSNRVTTSGGAKGGVVGVVGSSVKYL